MCKYIRLWKPAKTLETSNVCTVFHYIKNKNPWITDTNHIRLGDLLWVVSKLLDANLIVKSHILVYTTLTIWNFNMNNDFYNGPKIVLGIINWTLLLVRHFKMCNKRIVGFLNPVNFQEMSKTKKIKRKSYPKKKKIKSYENNYGFCSCRNDTKLFRKKADVIYQWSFIKEFTV